MKSDVVVKVKPGSIKKSIEHFGENRYLIKTDSVNNDEINGDVLFMLSKYMGLPPNRLEFKSGISTNDKVLQII
ncbi:hypothetical protein COU56_00525 [Candidatus Pacearchaeota archaeon CG10_big_fil_rev_8_21_14_0_10_31_9]|nr:MAG: hypothetical protein AUJ62_00095 [Candidatus Pacearchaeota archaeon CG1_02_32_21]PIN96065.1 MAG: hypothetical protein COU56_00525 [Candidatus Pacearchaeota archaeon CG10_big_fil_rev_8_21_14_0_10_31_9]